MREDPIGVDTEEFSPLGRKGRKKRVLFVGRFEAVKGIDIFMEASRHFEDVEFVMLGDDEEKLGQLPPTVKVEGKVSHEEMPEYYRKAQVVALPSYSEGLPRVCLEALACGTPVIASRVGGVPELVLDGETGFLVEPGNVDQLVERIEELLEDPELARERGQSGRSHIVENYDEDAIMFDLVRRLRSIAQDS